MTREEARQIVSDWLVSSQGEKGQCGYIEGWVYEKDVEAFRMAIEALEQEPKEDCISREYILSFLDGEVMGDDDYIAGMNDEQREIREVVRNAPSVTPTERTGEWIPVSEGLPKEKQEVYVTVYFTEGDTGRAYGYIDGFGNWHLYSVVEGTLNSGYEVTAWQPLPEIYRPEGENK